MWRLDESFPSDSSVKDCRLKLITAFNALTENKTVIMIAHRLKTIRNADWIVVLDGGTISTGTHEELLRSSEKYSSFIKLREEAASWKM